MAAWARLTHYDGDHVWVNLDAATKIVRWQDHDTTNISFDGDDDMVVKELPAEIFKKLQGEKWG